MNLVPVLGTGHNHAVHEEIFIHPVKSGRSAAAAAADHGSTDFSCHAVSGSIEKTIHERGNLAVGTAVIYGRTENQPVPGVQLFNDLVHRVLILYAPSMGLAVIAGDTSGYRFPADLKNFRVYVLFFQRFGDFFQSSVHAASSVGTAIDQ